jgi:peptidylprolyl isomerase
MFLACFGIPVNVQAAVPQSASVSGVAPVSIVQAGVTWNYTVTLNTTMGMIVIGLYDDMPITSGNFKNLTAHGIFDGTQFTRVAYGFVIQGGDTSSKGIVVPPIKDELPNKHSNIIGSVAMAKTSQPNSATSQFFINLANNTFLDSDYSVFGQVIQGMDVVNKIGSVPIIPVNSETDGTPVTPIIILKATLSSQVPEYTLISILPLFMIVTLFAVALQRRHRRIPEVRCTRLQS